MQRSQQRMLICVCVMMILRRLPHIHVCVCVLLQVWPLNSQSEIQIKKS